MTPIVRRDAAIVPLVLLAAALGCEGAAGDDDTSPGDDDATAPDDDTAPPDDDATPPDDDTAPPDDDTAPPDDDSTPAGWTYPLLFNELLADNEQSYQLPDGSAPDWIELYNPGGDDVVLDGFSVTDDLDAPDLVPLEGGLFVPAGGFLLLFADGDPDAGPDHLPFRLSTEGEGLGLYAPDGYPLDRVEFGPQEQDIAAARYPDGSETWIYTWLGTPGASNVEAEEPVPEPFEVFPGGGEWAYWDGDGLDGVDWYATDFDDAAWAVGVGPFGYGDAHQVTLLDYGPNPYDKRVTAYFRRAFGYEPPVDGEVTVLVSLMVDDGARIFLNGEEALRFNLPSGDLTSDSLALASMGGTAESSFYDHEVDPALLLPGENVVAVEVHQAAPDSSDLTFDLGLGGEVFQAEPTPSLPPPPRLPDSAGD